MFVYLLIIHGEEAMKYHCKAAMAQTAYSRVGAPEISAIGLETLEHTSRVPAPLGFAASLVAEYPSLTEASAQRIKQSASPPGVSPRAQ